MSKDIIRIDREEYDAPEKAIELGGENFDLPKRTGELNDKLIELENKRPKMNEYDFYAEMFAIIFGRANAKKILSDGKKTNLDYLSKIYRVSVNLIYEDKTEAEREEAEKRAETIAPILEKVDKMNPLLKVMK